MNQNLLFDKFVYELKYYLDSLQKEYDKRVQTYEYCKFLRQNYNFSLPVHQGIMKVTSKKVYECLTFFNELDEVTLEDIDAALYMCNAGEKNPKFKIQNRYVQSLDLLERIKIILRSHLFNKSENNRENIFYLEERIKKYSDLDKFISGELKEFELAELDSYMFSSANFSEKDWIDIYVQLMKMYMDYLLKIEEQSREFKKEQIIDVIDNMALAVEEKMMENLPPESVEVLMIQDSNEVANVVAQEVETEVQEPFNVDDHMVSVTDEEILKVYKHLMQKAREYKKYGRFDEYKIKLFSSLKSGIGVINSLEETKVAFIPSDYLKFLYYCFVTSLNNVTESLQDTYDEAELDDYVEIIKELIDSTKVYLDALEVELELQNQKVDQEVFSVSVEEQDQSAYKLVFYEKFGKIELERNMKDFTPEKLADLATIIKKIELGNIDGSKTISREVPVQLNALFGRYIFVTYRMLPDNHIMIFLAANLADLNKSGNRLGIYDMAVEDELSSIVRDGENSVEYRKMMKRNSEVKNNILNQGLVKGV